MSAFVQDQSLYMQLVIKESSHFNIWLKWEKKEGCQLLSFCCIIFESQMALDYYTYLEGKTRPFSS